MSIQSAARLARRETKRTLGNHLKAFAADQGARLQLLEGQTKILRSESDDAFDAIGRLKERVANVEHVLRRGFWGRLNYLVTGR